VSEPYAYSAETRGIVVRVRPQFLPDQSDPDQRRWVWAYHIEIENRGAQTVQLLGRHWVITDAAGHVEHVKGLGVVGEQPVLNAGDRFRYTSGCPLPTPSGAMEGSYRMASAAGEQFDITVPPFSLDLPHAARSLN
jgi:ApaG protein